MMLLIKLEQLFATTTLEQADFLDRFSLVHRSARHHE